MYINFNGEIIASKHPILHPSNRGFRYGDGLFESMALFNNKVKLLSLHASRLAQGAEVLELLLPEKLNSENIALEIERLRDANKLCHARIRIFLFRESAGNYEPESNNAGFIIEATPVENANYQLNGTGLELGVYQNILKPMNLLSTIKSCNALLYVKAGLYKKKMGWDECLILNTEGNLCESISSNLFWIQDHKVYTPSRESGCILGVMRQSIVNDLAKNKFELNEGEYPLASILDAEEVFLSNATRGIQWVSEINVANDKLRFNNLLTKQIFNGLYLD